ncbi:MAG: MATE family efflux transporter, partial [Solobacterium sp.]|nr:MATE family efflux transporter [Solobacterium sp.]
MTNDLTKGPIFSALIRFTIPLIAGNLLQLTYNAVDSMIVGRYVGKEALAAVGTSNPLMTLVLLFTNGICLGAGLLVSYQYGAKDHETLQRQVSTGLCAGGVFSLSAGILTALLSVPIMKLLQADPAILSEASGYLRIIMLGLVFSFLYNYFASMLRAMGDSRSPLIFLAISTVLNILGDMILVAWLRLGIVGAAISTVVCEALSAVLCWRYIYRNIPILRLGRKWLIVDYRLLKKTLSFGIVSALQQSSVQLGKLVIQGFVNTLGVSATAAFNAVNRTDDFAIVPEQNIAHAMSSVMAQNAGAHHASRMRKTFRYGIYLELGFSLFVMAVLYTMAEDLMRLFTMDAEVIQKGVDYLHLIAFMYPLPAMTNGIQGYFRGTGDLRI